MYNANLFLNFQAVRDFAFLQEDDGLKNNKNDFIVPLMIYQLNELKCN